MWKFVWEFVKPHLADKAFWVSVLGWILMGLNKWLKLGFDDNIVNALVVSLATYAVTHLAHTTVNKDKTNE